MGQLGSGSSFGPGCALDRTERLALSLWQPPPEKPISLPGRARNGTADLDAVLLKNKTHHSYPLLLDHYQQASREAPQSPAPRRVGWNLPNGELPFRALPPVGHRGWLCWDRPVLSPVPEMLLLSPRKVTLEGRIISTTACHCSAESLRLLKWLVEQLGSLLRTELEIMQV